jgi:hypothetical protein
LDNLDPYYDTNINPRDTHLELAQIDGGLGGSHD